MGVYIKGMEMPRSCYNCKLDLRTDICSTFLKWKDEHPYSIKGNDRLPGCPLIEVPEPHGRLIDENELTVSTDNIVSKIMIFGGQVCYSRSDIDNAPTVIEAEGE